MATITAPQHDVFNAASSNTQLFPNDFTSANEVERHTRRAADEKAEQERIQKEKKELDGLRTLRIALESEKKSLEKQNNELREDNDFASKTIHRMKDALETLTHMSDLRLPHFSLDPLCHGRFAQFVLLANMRSALDCGKGELKNDTAKHSCCSLYMTNNLALDHGAMPHGWTFGLDYTWQKVTLWRVDSSDPTSPWLIQSKCNWYLEMVADESGKLKAKMNERKNEGQAKQQQEWRIGRCPGEGIV